LCSLVSKGGDARPLALAEERLALARHVALGDRRARALARRARRRIVRDAKLDARIAAAGVLATPEGPVPLAEEQIAAMRAAVLGRQVAIAGGPGTGKTSIVAAIARALAGGEAPLVAPESVALAAPTGKAADRIFASLSATLRSDAALLARLGRAETLHRLLGYRPSDGTFTFHAQNPLPHRLVVVDEASMLDLALAERLVRALSPEARLVLLGDPDQLPSVDPGAVLADLVRGLEGGAPSPVPIARLTTSHRTDARDPGGAEVRRTASALREGMLAASTLRLVADPTEAARHASGVGLHAARRSTEAFHTALFATWLEPVLALAHAPFDLALEAGRQRLDACLDRLSRMRLLTVTRTGGPSSAEGVNARLGRLAISHGGREETFVAGEPLLAHRNDYDRELRNGDQGMVARLRTSAGVLRAAVFRRAERFVQHPLDAVLGTVERAYATTVHKAQGSEHDHVALVLPDEDVPLLLRRELLYTALTRARKSAMILGDPTLLERGVKRASHRVTGLRSSMQRASVGNGQGGGGD
ncbi:MAG: AAA family ATPase, partial [Sandaracinaceae bacterium]|nr:AAA family ATPase [Sandaracinaceae bacterium]